MASSCVFLYADTPTANPAEQVTRGDCSNKAALQDLAGHGTHTAGIMAAPINGMGVSGVAPDAKIVVLSSALGSVSVHRMAYPNAAFSSTGPAFKVEHTINNYASEISLASPRYAPPATSPARAGEPWRPSPDLNIPIEPPPGGRVGSPSTRPKLTDMGPVRNAVSNQGHRNHSC